MKILFAWVFPIEPLNGGVERVTAIIMEGLRARGHVVDNLICEHDNHNFYTHNMVCEKNHIPLLKLQEYLSAQKYDVIVCQDGYSRTMTRTFRENAPATTKVTCSLHSSPTMWEEIYSKSNVLSELRRTVSLSKMLFWAFRLLIHPYWKREALQKIGGIYRENYTYCDRYVLLSESFFPGMLRYLGLRNDGADKLRAIPNPLSFDSIADPAILQRKQKEVLMVTRLDETQKRVSYALGVWKTIQRKGYHDWTLRIVGHGPDEIYLRALVRRHHIPHVIFEGRKNPVSYYERASLFLMTSDFEGWGMTLTEAMQYGVVTVARDTYLSLHDIIREGYNGLLADRDNSRQFADKLMYLMDHQQKREELALNGLRYVARFNKSNIVSSWEKLMKDL